ncbi:phage tail protein [Solihabitans fulvus]|uniref:Phage tail protein n=1 Tax=Solihabitans fulvus TaxID=1892852 RepID=A0A5B2X5Z7_9PSEU|nr:phage tail protein [Solihabitans fulvus]KAA2258798.1 phage tail protein [Solihabitans fulvus]
MRGTVAGLGTARSLGQLLPAVYQEEDPFVLKLLAALDEVLAPVLSTLDCLEAYLDPGVAPVDFLDWLAGWVGVSLDEGAHEERRRAAVASAAALHRVRGTVAGLREHLELLTGGRVEVSDSGGVSWSTTPGGALPGEDVPRLAVRVTGADPGVAGLVDAMVAASKPAHVMHRVEVVEP